MNNKEFNIEEVVIDTLRPQDPCPMDLLLLADPSEELVKQYLEGGETFVASINGITVGVILLLGRDAESAEIMNVAVAPDYQNRGIGKRLVRYAIDKARERNYKIVEIGTGNPGVQQMLLYQKCGFRIIGVDLDFFRRTHPEPIFENGIECRDMIRMRIEF